MEQEEGGRGDRPSSWSDPGGGGGRPPPLGLFSCSKESRGEGLPILPTPLENEKNTHMIRPAGGHLTRAGLKNAAAPYLLGD